MKLDFLDFDELERITCRKKPQAMAKRLKAMRIPFIPDGNGWPLVLRSNLDAALCKDKLSAEEQVEVETDNRFRQNLANAFDHLKQHH